MVGPLSTLWNLNDPGWKQNGKASSDHGPDSTQDPSGQEPQRAEGPPDLDELWRDFNQKLNNLFGKKGAGNRGNDGGGVTPSPNMKGAGLGFGLIMGMVLLLWLGSGFFIVQEGQVAVVLQFGKYHHTTGAGFQWRLPYPFQTHEIVSLAQVREIKIGYQGDIKNKVSRESLMLTDDENIIDIQFSVQYRLKDAMDFLFNNRDPEASVKQVAETAIREVVGKSKMDFVLQEGRQDVARKTELLMQQILDRYKSGILITTVNIQNAQAPEQVQAAFQDAVNAGQDRERMKNEGQAYANDVIPRARGTASRLAEEAQGYAQRVVANAEGDAGRFKSILSEYSKAPAVTRERLYLETMQKIFESTTKIMVDAKGGNNLLYLPLDKILQQTTVDSAPKPAATLPVPDLPQTQAIISETGRSREALRNRARESR